MPRRFAAFLLAASFAIPFASPASAQFVFVGPASDPDCDYETIQQAVDAWAISPSTDFVTLIIANAQAWPAQAISIPTPLASSGIELRGEYPGCRLEAQGGRAVIDGAGGVAAPVIDIQGTVAGDEARFEVVLGNLDITGGDHVGENGGGVRMRGNVVLSVVESRIHDNAAQNGAGIAVEATAAGAPHLIMLGNQRPTAIVDNDASGDGGGLFCAAATMYCDRYCLIGGNTAGGNGGGVAQHDCGTSMFPQTNSANTDPDVGLRMNTAAGEGGGAWVSGGYFGLDGILPGKPAPVFGNIAGGDGGGLYYTGLGDATNMHRGVQFDDNRAGGDGGALFADSGFLQLFALQACGEAEGCMRFRGNHADAAGGAIALSGNANGLLNNVMFAGNEAAQASVLQVGGAGTGVTLTNVHVAGNRGASELLRSSGGYIDLRYVSVADNGGDDDALVRFDAAGSFSASNAVLHDANGADSGVVVAEPGGTAFNLDCVLVHDDTGLAGQPGVTHLVVADPQWDASALAEGLYVPGPDSPAVDACAAGTGTIPDLLGTARPQDLPKPDGAGPYDMGAIERLPERIFADGFDSLPE
jgi:predicted outer membrane repeat protein